MAHTPELLRNKGPDTLDPTKVDVARSPWNRSSTAGIDVNILLEEPKVELLTAPYFWKPETELPRHKHIGIEQTCLPSGGPVDDQGKAIECDYVRRPKGSRYLLGSPNGAWVISSAHKPSKFLAGELAEKELK